MIFRVIWFGGGSVDRTLWFGGSAEPHRTTKFGRTRSRSRTVRSFTNLQQFNHVQLSSTKLSSGLRSTKIEEIQLISTIPKLSKTRPKNLVTKSVDS